MDTTDTDKTALTLMNVSTVTFVTPMLPASTIPAHIPANATVALSATDSAAMT